MLKVEHLNVVYPNGLHALENADFALPEGSICGIIGPNGGGKTTLLKGILGLIPAGGNVHFREKPIRQFAKKTAYVEQRSEIDKDFPITVFQCVLLGTYPALGFFKRPGKTEKLKAENALEKVGLSDLRNRQIGELSGGQFQRVLIARTLTQEADLIFLDEPFVGIDVTSEAIIIRLLKELSQQGKTILIVHHDLKKVEAYFSYVMMVNRKITHFGPTADVFQQSNLKETFRTLTPSNFI